MSRLRSARGPTSGTGTGTGTPKTTRGAAKPGKPGKAAKVSATPTAARSARPGVFVQKPKSDIYVAMLGVSLGAILLAVILMALLLSSYKWTTTPPALLSAPAELFSTVHL
ncbi:MAG TPA: hypothetical protein VG406_24665 [Isosphaeraceae bacterium]|jgi:hypothetical protein|nr:hypothetical protein [Isosphaeraceae bacterium]